MRQHTNRAGLGKRLDHEHAGLNRATRKVAREVPRVAVDRRTCAHTLTGDEFRDLVDQQKWVTMRDDRLDHRSAKGSYRRHGSYPSETVSPVGQHIELTTCGSTQDELRDLAEAGAGVWSTVRAEVQTAGRGRRAGRHWVAAPGTALLVSILLKPRRETTELPALGIVTAIAVCDALDRMGLAAQIKWPNDVVVGARKIAGVLPDLWPGGLVGLGIGINLDMRKDQLPDLETTTSVRVELGTAKSAHEAFPIVMRYLHPAVSAFDRGGFALLQARAGELDALRGHELVIERGNGTTEYGVGAGIAADGALLVERDGEIRGVHSADVRRVR